MLKREELTLRGSCLNKARSDEPLFVLRANDPLAPQTVRHWATMAEGVHETEKIVDALAWADQAEAFRREKEPKVAVNTGRISGTVSAGGQANHTQRDRDF